MTCTVTGDPTTPENTAQPLDNTQNTVRDQQYTEIRMTMSLLEMANAV